MEKGDGGSDSGLPRLITLALSPYNDFARWALDRSRVPYREERKALVHHIFASRRARGKGTTPVLVTEDEVVADSAEIAEWADDHGADPGALFGEGEKRKEIQALVKHFADDLGTETRPLFWAALIEDLPLANRLWSQGLSPRAARAQPWLLRGAKPAIKRSLNVRDNTVETTVPRIRQIFDGVASRLKQQPRLAGDGISAADLSFAAMAAPALMPSEGHPTRYPDPSELSEPVAEAMRGLRAHPAGQYALRLYRDER